MTPAQSSASLTSREYWVDYWRSKGELRTRIPERFLFAGLFDEILRRHPIRTSIELGGFPGQFSIWLRKYRQVETDLLDFFIDRPLLDDLLARNGLAPGAVGGIEGDLFSHQPKKKYDLVFSLGLIEHFADTRAVIERHLAFLADSGVLFIEVPNFRGVNGLVQRTFDRDNYDKHNIGCMDPAFLRRTCEDLGLTVELARYDGGFGVWLESPAEKTRLARWTVALLSRAGLTLQLLSLHTRVLSPYIVLIASRRH